MSGEEDRAMESTVRLKGVVIQFHPRKGYGFIRSSEGGDYFVHYSDVRGKGYRTLVKGEEVEFSVRKGEKGWQAVDVRRLNPPATLETPPLPGRKW